MGGGLLRWIATASTARVATTAAIAAASRYRSFRKSGTAKGTRNTTPTAESAAISRSRGAGSGSSGALQLSSRPRAGGFAPRAGGAVTAAIVAPDLRGVIRRRMTKTNRTGPLTPGEGACYKRLANLYQRARRPAGHRPAGR